MARKGWTAIQSVNKHLSDGYFDVTTEYGTKTAAPWGLALQFDPHEVGEGPEHVTLGVDLSSRYFPTFIDMKNSHGTLDGIDFDVMYHDIQIAKEEILKLVPELADAKVIIRDIFY